MSDAASIRAFSQNAFTLSINRRLIEGHAIPAGVCLDVGAGTGETSRILVEHAPAGTRVILVDCATHELSKARELLGSRAGYVAAKAETLERLFVTPVDAAFFFNCVHLVEDKSALFRSVRSGLRSGSLLAFNTSFIAGAEPEEATGFYRSWVRSALKMLKREYGFRPTKERVAARRRLSSDEYTSCATNEGFEIVEATVDRVEMPMTAFYGLCHYPDWVAGILPGVDFDVGSAVLQRSLSRTQEAMNLTHSPRLWLRVVALAT